MADAAKAAGGRLWRLSLSATGHFAPVALPATVHVLHDARGNACALNGRYPDQEADHQLNVEQVLEADPSTYLPAEHQGLAPS